MLLNFIYNCIYIKFNISCLIWLFTVIFRRKMENYDSVFSKSSTKPYCLIFFFYLKKIITFKAIYYLSDPYLNDIFFCPSHFDIN